MKLRWTERSVRNLDSINAYISQDNPAAAARQCTLIFRTAEMLRTFPRTGRRTGLPGRSTLTVPNTAYLIDYRIDGEILHILAVRHGAQNL